METSKTIKKGYRDIAGVSEVKEELREFLDRKGKIIAPLSGSEDLIYEYNEWKISFRMDCSVVRFTRNKSIFFEMICVDPRDISISKNKLSIKFDM